ncbi:MAG: thiamine pyrophosphate-binding protein, partial [Gammaproteobacteria bacterium]|nr:thiamine pyrophosphate-binding protein [Gammaproteobacteria bacterium]
MEAINLQSSHSKNTSTKFFSNKKKSIADVVVDTLVQAGVSKVFGIPGGATIPFHVSLEKHEDIDFVLAKHEGGAAFMADCYSRLSGNLSVCCSTTGPGATNLMTGVASAYMDSIPMLVVTGMNPIDTWGRGDFQESTPYTGIDTTDMFKSICKHSEIIVSEKILQFRLRCAIAKALSGRPGPVHIAIPRDLWTKEVTPEYWYPHSYLSQPPSASEQDVLHTADFLRLSSRPLVLFGSGASSNAVSQLMEICEYLSIPIASTPRAKGKDLTFLSKTYIGSVGIAATASADNLLANNKFDVILTVGSGFGSYATNSWN